MKQSIVLVLAAAALLTGCESSKQVVAAKHYNLIVHNVSSMACSFVTMDTIQEKYDIKDVVYHEDANGVTCADYNHTDDDTCKVVDAKEELGENSDGIGDRSCILGSDTKPGKNFAFFDAVDLQDESNANR